MNMKKIFLVTLIMAAAVVWGDPGATEARLVPFTGVHVNLIQDIEPDLLKGLEFYLSENTSITPKRNNVSSKPTIIDGALVENSGQNTSAAPIEFTRNDKGTLRTRQPASNSIVVYFKEDIPLVFRREPQGRYKLDSAEIDLENNTLDFKVGGPIYLLIKFDDGRSNNRAAEAQAVRDSELGGQRRTDLQQPAFRDRDSGRQSYQTLNASSFARSSPSRNIEWRGTVTERGVAAYVMNQTPSVNRDTLSRLINTYFDESEIESINHDIAIAQMLHATNFLRNNQRMTTRNYAGFISTPGWSGRFSSMTEGVRAHIQHLKGYASARRLNSPLVDPRYQILADKGYLGNVRTLDQLFSHWTASPASYANSIDRILDGLYRFSD